MGTGRGGGVGARCVVNTATITGGGQETSWHHQGHKSIIITRAFIITKGRYPVVLESPDYGLRPTAVRQRHRGLRLQTERVGRGSLVFIQNCCIFLKIRQQNEA